MNHSNLSPDQCSLDFDFTHENFIASPPWRGFFIGPTLEELIALHDKALAKIPFTSLEELIFDEFCFAPVGFHYDTQFNLIKNDKY